MGEVTMECCGVRDLKNEVESEVLDEKWWENEVCELKGCW